MGQQRLSSGHFDSSPTANRCSSYSVARKRLNQLNSDVKHIQRATGLATEVQQVIEAPSPMHTSPSDSIESSHEIFQEAEASGSSSRGVYKQASTSRAGSNSGMQPFSYAPAESDQIRESWDSLMRWSKVRMTHRFSGVDLNLTKLPTTVPEYKEARNAEPARNNKEDCRFWRRIIWDSPGICPCKSEGHNGGHSPPSGPGAM